MRRNFNLLSKLLLAISATMLAACVTTGPEDSLSVSSGTFTILREALITPVTDLNARADSGEARAQFSLSLIYLYGLRHLPADLEVAKTFRKKALAGRGYTPTTQYIPGLKGKPSRTVIINTPRYEVGIYEAKINQTCAMALNAGEDTPAAFKACGNEAAYREFKPLWAGAKG